MENIAMAYIMDHLCLEATYIHKEYWSEKTRFVISIKKKTDIEISCLIWAYKLNDTYKNLCNINLYIQQKHLKILCETKW